MFRGAPFTRAIRIQEFGANMIESIAILIMIKILFARYKMITIL